MSISINDWYRAIEESPDDFALLAIFADWCEEAGDIQRAECLRWQATKGKRCFKSGWNYNWISSYDALCPVRSELPNNLFDLLRKKSIRISRYETRREADDDLLQAFIRWEGKYNDQKQLSTTEGVS
jgi:uncharacterized protein (TIGR02996 family)